MKKLLWKLAAIVTAIGLVSVASVLAAEQTIKGTVEIVAQGIVLKAEDGQSYEMEGKNLKKMVGKTVEATGVLVETKAGRFIKVTKIEEVKMKE
jgi:hypothetical protein